MPSKLATDNSLFVRNLYHPVEGTFLELFKCVGYVPVDWPCQSLGIVKPVLSTAEDLLGKGMLKHRREQALANSAVVYDLSPNVSQLLLILNKQG